MRLPPCPYDKSPFHSILLEWVIAPGNPETMLELLLENKY